jgi:phage terminase large subunit
METKILPIEINFKSRNDKQIEAASYWFDDSTDEILYGGAKGGGKSYLGCSLVFGDALTYPETHYFIARKELIDLRKFTIPSIYEVFEHWGLKIDDYAKYNGQDNCFILYNKSKVFLISCDDTPSDPLFERFGSMQMTKGWIEEGGEVPEDAKANLWLSIGRWKNEFYKIKGKLLITANPKKGWMKRDFVDPFKQGILPNTRKYIQAYATDNTYLPKSYVEKLNSETNNVRRERLAKGNWDYEDDSDSLISSDALSDSFSNTVVKDNRKFLVVDVARKGKDSTIFSFWNGLELYKLEEMQKQGTDKTEQQVKDFAASEHVPYSQILIDEDGIGGGVVDHLLGVKGFTANSSPIQTSAQIRERKSKIEHSFIQKPIYSNLKSQCGWKLAELINEHKIAIRVPEYRDRIIEELSSQLRDKHVDGDGKKQLRPKDEVKDEIKRSPDVGDTIIMRMFFELVAEALAEDPGLKRAQEEQSVSFIRNKRQIAVNSTK